jgi:deazaflavin-dependent oxidoreductase (nitroreductase family)
MSHPVDPAAGSAAGRIPGHPEAPGTGSPDDKRLAGVPATPGSRGVAPPGSAASRPARQYRPGRGRHVENTIMSALVRAGLVPRSYLLTTRGRKTGRPRTNPVVPVEHDGRRWLVAPYGPVSWVLNARAAGRVTLTRGRNAREYAIREVAAEEAGPILKQYVRIATATRRYFLATKDSPVEDFITEADRHPVFELIAVDKNRQTEPPAR